jgi:hypothetical protein
MIAEHLPLPPSTPDSIFFRVLIFRITATRKPELAIVQITYAPRTPTDVNINGAVGSIEDSEFGKAQLLALGSGARVMDELYSGHNPKYNSLRNLDFVKQFIIGHQAVEGVSKEKAAEVSRAFIRLASENVKDFSGYDDISPESDCLVVPYEGGITSLP